MTARRVQVDESRDVEGLEALADSWRVLWEADPDASVFQTPEWLLAWRRHIGPGVGLRTLAVREDGRLVGLAPLFLHAAGDGVRQLTWLGNGISDSLGPLAAPGRADAVARAVAGHLAATGAGWDTADLRDMPEDAALAAAEVAGAESVLEPDEPRSVLPLAPPAQPSDRLDPKLRRDLAQGRRRAEALGPVHIRAADTASVDDDLVALFDLHARRWTGRGQPGVLADPQVQRFHREVAAAAAARGWLRLYVLTVGGELAGVHYGFTAKGRACFYLGGFDARFDRISPGGLLIEHALTAAVEEGAVAADFLRGREGYKQRWGAVEQPQVRRRLRAPRPG